MSRRAVHSAVGWEVTAKWTGRRRSCESTMKTKSIRNVEVGTAKKSVDTKSVMWFFRKVFQVWDGGLRLWTMYLATAVWEIAIPSLSNSPWIRVLPSVDWQGSSRESGLGSPSKQAADRSEPDFSRSSTVGSLS